jgi:hypothetical protein
MKREDRSTPTEQDLIKSGLRLKYRLIVTPSEWDLAQEVLKRNSKNSTRNGARGTWLLQRFVRCEICKDYTFVAILGNTKNNPRRYYGCASRNSEKQRMLGTACRTPYVYADVLERRVWEEIENIIYDPNIVINQFDERANEELATGYQAQLDYIDRRFEELAVEKAKFEAAYNRDIYTLDEFEIKMKDIKGKRQALDVSRSKVDAMLAETHSLEEKKQVVLKALGKIRSEVEKARMEKKIPQEIPFKLKRKILSSLVEVIWVNSLNRTFKIVGDISDVFTFDYSDEENETLSGNGGENSSFAFTSIRKWQ